MATLTWPDSLPKPSLSGNSLALQDSFLRDANEGPVMDQRKRFGDIRYLNITFRTDSRSQTRDFFKFLNDDLESITKWFKVSWPIFGDNNGCSTAETLVRFISYPSRTGLGYGVYDISCQLEVKRKRNEQPTNP